MSLSIYPSANHPSVHSPIFLCVFLLIHSSLAHLCHPSIHLPSIHLTELPRTSYVTGPWDGEMTKTQPLPSQHCSPSLRVGLDCSPLTSPPSIRVPCCRDPAQLPGMLGRAMLGPIPGGSLAGLLLGPWSSPGPRCRLPRVVHPPLYLSLLFPLLPLFCLLPVLPAPLTCSPSAWPLGGSSFLQT